MKHPWRIGCFGILLACAGCTAWVYTDLPGDPPPSASTVIDPTPAGFAQVYQRECIDQADLKWAVGEAARRVRWNCFGDEASDCASNDAQELSYLVPTRDNSTAIVGFFLDSNLQQISQCMIDVSDRHAPALRAAIVRLRVGGKGFVPYDSGKADVWCARPSKIDKNTLCFWRDNEFYSQVTATFWPDYANGPDQAHPWAFSYTP